MPVSDYIRRMRSHIGHDLLMLMGVAAVIRNEQGEILLQHRSDNNQWGLLGGGVDPGEEPAEAILREAREEAGITVLPERIVGVYGGESHLITYPNGDQCAYISITFECRLISGEPHVNDDESLAFRWFAPDNLPENIMPHHVPRIQHALTLEKPYFRLPDEAAP